MVKQETLADMRERQGRRAAGTVDSAVPERSVARCVAVFTALDGTLLDPLTFDAGANRARVSELLERGARIVPVSVMTLDEISPVAEDLGFTGAMIIEAGGAIARRSGSAWTVEAVGPEGDALLEAIRQIEEAASARLLVYSVLSHRDASQLSGRAGAMLEASTRRRFSEPFLIEDGDFAAVRRAARALGFEVRRGRRFLYLCRAGDLRSAFRRVATEMGCGVTIGAGGSMADAEFLRLVDVPIIVPPADGAVDRDLRRSLPDVVVASGPAPEGWALVHATASRIIDEGPPVRTRASRSA